ncbi:thiol-disulfide isomerase/thioredoxin [Tibeticola sediminis]|uniref:Thiol-disulfide isomerase/thioredoxin n=1 Tax=Tibeticola sediminis TaxID=1917811 RepID=A0A3N4UPE0_9BURK|nr:TlpA disulfide reductase family protein [Tibeticola sediminis]RPE72472.1 thiol-disulfide isomerase/thioredoxin [Tibeticola sediminis]
MPSRRRTVLTHAAAWAAVSTLPRWSAAQTADAGAASAAAAEAKAPPLPAVGSFLKLPALTLLDGTAFRPEQADGHVCIVYWWASTCPFCALQSPEMQKLWLSHRDRGLVMLTLSIDKKPQDAEAYLKKKGYSFPAAWVTPEVQRVLPKPRGLPITLVRSREGKVLQAERGQMFAEEVEQLAHWL